MAQTARMDSSSPADATATARVPCTFSQIAHWRQRLLGQPTSFRQIAAAIRVRGRFDLALFQRSVLRTIRRHDALRTQLIMQDELLLQVVSAEPTFEWSAQDLRELPQSLLDNEIQRQIGDFILRPMNIDVDPLLAVRALEVAAEEHVLLFAMEHSISDMRSMGVFLSDVFSLYAAAVAGRTSALPNVAVQFSQYAERQQTAEQTDLARRGLFLIQRLAKLPALRFPETQVERPETGSKCGSVTLTLPSDLKARFRAQARDLRTTVPMLGLAAYIAALMSTCRARSGTFKCFTDGRTRPELHHTIGFLACPLYLGICLSEHTRFADLIQLVTGEYCLAHQHADHFYLESLERPPEFLRTHAFNWIPQMPSKLEASHTHGEQDEICLQPVFFENPVYTHWPMENDTTALFQERPDDICVQFLYHKDRVSSQAMEQFAASFAPYLEALLQQPRTPLNQIRIVQ